MAPKVKAAIEEANAERAQVRRAYGALKVELEQTTARADNVLERLRKKSESKTPPLRLVKSK